MTRIGDVGQALIKGVIIAVLAGFLGLVALAGPLTRGADRDDGAAAVQAEPLRADGETTKEFPLLEEPRQRAPELPSPTPSPADSSDAL